MTERERKRIELDHNKFREDPIRELIRIRPEQRVEVTALSHIKTQRQQIFFLKRYEQYIEKNVDLKTLDMCGGPIKLAYKNITGAINMIYTPTKEWNELSNDWNKSIKKAKIFDYLLI